MTDEAKLTDEANAKLADEAKKLADEKKYARLPYFRKVKALTTLIRAESFLREHIMLGGQVGMLTEGAITETKAKESLDEAVAYLNGKKDDELRGWIDIEHHAVNEPSTEYALAVPNEPAEEEKKS